MPSIALSGRSREALGRGPAPDVGAQGRWTSSRRAQILAWDSAITSNGGGGCDRTGAKGRPGHRRGRRHRRRHGLEALARAGASVVASDLKPIDQTSSSVALALQQDVTRDEDWARSIAAVTERFGRLDILVNNAGRALTRGLEDTSLEDWHQVMAVNLDSVFLGVRHAIGVMKERPTADGDTASIVNLSSVAGLVGAPMLAAYSAAKGGVRHFTKSAALYCADRGYPIRINSIHPGFTDTALLDGIAGALGETEAMKDKIARRQPLKRLATAEEIAEAVVFLAGPQSSYMTGSELVVDGGFTAQ